MGAAGWKVRAATSYVHQPDILNPIPSSRASPVVCKKNGKLNEEKLEGGNKEGRVADERGNKRFGKLKTRLKGVNLDRLKSQFKRKAGCEWEKFHKELASKLARVRQTRSDTHVAYQPLAHSMSETNYFKSPPKHQNSQSSKSESRSLGKRRYYRLVQSENETDDDDGEEEFFAQSSSSEIDYLALA